MFLGNHHILKRVYTFLRITGGGKLARLEFKFLTYCREPQYIPSISRNQRDILDFNRKNPVFMPFERDRTFYLFRWFFNECVDQPCFFILWIYTIIHLREFCKQIGEYFFGFISTEQFYVLYIM